MKKAKKSAPKRNRKPKLNLDALAKARKAIEANRPPPDLASIFADPPPNWRSIDFPDHSPGLYVQRSTPNGSPVYEVVRLVWVDGGNGLKLKVTTPDMSEEHSPLIVCHSLYQPIKENE